MHLTASLLCGIVLTLPVFSIGGENGPMKLNQNSTVLIVGSSLPALLIGWVLSSYNISVTMAYSGTDVDNQISNTMTSVGGETYILPKMQPIIFENSKMALQLINYLIKSNYSENGFSLYFENHAPLSVSSSSTVYSFLSNLITVGCINGNDTKLFLPFIDALQKYNYTLFRSKYSNITLAQFGKLMKVPESSLACVMNLLTINSGMNMDNFNAADAIGRIVFYFLQTLSPLRNYYLLGETSTGDLIKGLVEQIVDKMKSNNVKFLPNSPTTRFFVSKGKIVGVNDGRKQYDLLILGDSFRSSLNIIQKTYNENDNMIRIPLEKTLSSMKSYSPGPNMASIKIWLNTNIISRMNVIEVANSPYPCSLQSIKQLTNITIPYHLNTILEIIVSIGIDDQKIDWDKIYRELFELFPTISLQNIEYKRVDWLDTGVVMNTAYGMNRLTTDSIQKAGIQNLILAADWLDPVDSNVFDLERSIAIAKQAIQDLKVY